MYRIVSSRSTGKTSRLILLAKENNGTIVCSNPNAMRQKALAYGIIGIDFISYSDFILRSRGANAGNYFIDELECFLDAFQSTMGMKGTLCGYTISEDD